MRWVLLLVALLASAATEVNAGSESSAAQAAADAVGSDSEPSSAVSSPPVSFTRIDIVGNFQCAPCNASAYYNKMALSEVVLIAGDRLIYRDATDVFEVPLGHTSTIAVPWPKQGCPSGQKNFSLSPNENDNTISLQLSPIEDAACSASTLAHETIEISRAADQCTFTFEQIFVKGKTVKISGPCVSKSMLGTMLSTPAQPSKLVCSVFDASLENTYEDTIASYNSVISKCTEMIDVTDDESDLLGEHETRAGLYKSLQDFDDAISDYTFTIDIFASGGGKVFDELQNEGRAESYMGNGDFDDAIADYDKVEKQAAASFFPTDRGERSLAYFGKQDLNKAIAELDAAIDQNTTELKEDSFAPDRREEFFLWRGLMQVYSSSFVEADADFDRSLAYRKYGTTSITATLWLAISAQRQGKDSAALVADTLEHIKGRDTFWPGPLLHLFQVPKSGSSAEWTPATVLAAAETVDNDQFDRTEREKVCDADFYTGEWLLARGPPEQALPLFQAALKKCLGSQIEYGAAEAELRRLASAPPVVAAVVPGSTAPSPAPSTGPVPAAAAQAAAPAPGVASETEIAFWNTIAQSKDPADFAAYLNQFPDGSFAALAKNRLKTLAPPAAGALQ